MIVSISNLRLFQTVTNSIIIIDSVPPPDGITLSLDRPGWLVFSWSEVVTGCEAVRYRIFASNCGRCPTTTAHTTAVCTDVPTNGNNNCTFAVQTIVCDSVAGNASDPIHALLRGIYVYCTMIIPISDTD